MNVGAKRTAVFLTALVIFIVVLSFALLTYTRRVDGTSMLPTLEEGDLVVVVHVPFNTIHPGDIIVYDGTCSGVFYNGSPAAVIHRVIQNTSLGFITKGDNNPGTDQDEHIARRPITADCIEGKVVFVIPYVELLAALPDGLNYILAALLLLAVVVYELWGTPAPRGKEGEGQSQEPEAERQKASP